MSMSRRLAQSVLGENRYRRLMQNLNSFKRLVRPKHEAEESALGLLVKPGDVVFEIGANYGQYARVFSPLVGSSGRVYAFEPATITFQYLLRTIRMLRLRNASAHRVALSDRAGEDRLYTSIKASGVYSVAGASLHPDPDMPFVDERVERTTLDEFIESKGIKSVNFLRCDVEGGELNVFMGGRRTLEQFHPGILVEVHPEMMARFGQSLAQLESYLRELGYGFYRWTDNRFVSVPNLGGGNFFLFVEPPP